MNCPHCQHSFDPRLFGVDATLQPQMISLLRQSLPGWQPSTGLCPNCALHFSQIFATRRQAQSLHITSDPHTTFPYYHAAEETVLGQAERNADYFTFPAHGVTVAFLDSGYYPHPDLGLTPRPSPLTPSQELRLLDYIDLTDGGERTGLEQPSLWDGAGDSWHGQMTAVIACGNGSLSGGRYRGFAPAASILPIKIGRGGGRIPEEDILAGLNWLLRNDNWARYNVRVLNISVGGDFVQPWDQNPVCLAAEKLIERGVLIAAAAGNAGRNALLAPAQAPSVLTVGGYDDHNRLWNSALPDHTRQLSLYHHNWATIKITGKGSQQIIAKPELLALGRFVPGPILPVSPVWHEMETISELQQVLGMNVAGDEWRVAGGGRRLVESELTHVDRAVRRAMNAHKWIHRYYQHVDGTSAAVAQVSAVAAQMVQANPKLSPLEIRTLLCESAMPLPASTSGHTGHGMIQPAAAVAAALRTQSGLLRAFPRSGTVIPKSELQKWQNLGKVEGNGFHLQQFYFGLYAPNARSVSLIAPFNGWTPGANPLQRTENGWWHTILPVNSHTVNSHAVNSNSAMPYRFWVEDEAHPAGLWLPDPENPLRCESGFSVQHSVVRSA